MAPRFRVRAKVRFYSRVQKAGAWGFDALNSGSLIRDWRLGLGDSCLGFRDYLFLRLGM